jgi:predicted GTPase
MHPEEKADEILHVEHHRHPVATPLAGEVSRLKVALVGNPNVGKSIVSTILRGFTESLHIVQKKM